MLTGTEIKSIRDGKATISEAYARIDNGELWLIGSNVAPYSHGNRANHEPDRPRKLLVHRRELERLRAAAEQKGLTLVPLRLHLKQGLAKLDIGVGRGKKLYDKRTADADRQARTRRRAGAPGPRVAARSKSATTVGDVWLMRPRPRQCGRQDHRQRYDAPPLAEDQCGHHHPKHCPPDTDQQMDGQVDRRGPGAPSRRCDPRRR